MGLRERKVSLSDEEGGGGGITNGDENKKFCTDCKTTKTPLWRGGPAGPKSLCNACGIRYRKKRGSNMLSSSDFDKKARSQRKFKIRFTSNTTIKSNTNTTSSENTTTTSRCRSIHATEPDEADAFDGNDQLISQSLRVSLMVLGKKVILQEASQCTATPTTATTTSTTTTNIVKKQRCQRRRKFGEQEKQAAFCLMALSCGSISA